MTSQYDVPLSAGLDTTGVTSGEREIIRSFAAIRSAARTTETAVTNNLVGFARNFLTTSLSVGALTLAYDKAARAAMAAERTNARLTATLRGVTSAASLTFDEISSIAAKMAKTTLFDDEGIKDASANLLMFRNVSRAVFEDTLRVAADLASFMNTDIPAAAAMLGRALENPATAADALRRARIKLTDEEDRAIAVAAALGRTEEAQGLVLDALRSRVGGLATELNTGLVGSFATATKATEDFFKVLGGSKMVADFSIGLRKTATDTMGAMETIVRAADSRYRNGGGLFGSFLGGFSENLREQMEKMVTSDMPPMWKRFAESVANEAKVSFQGTDFLSVGSLLAQALWNSFATTTENILPQLKGILKSGIDQMRQYLEDEGRALLDQDTARRLGQRGAVIPAPGTPKSLDELRGRAPNRQPGIGSVTVDPSLPTLPQYAPSRPWAGAEDLSTAGTRSPAPMPAPARPAKTELEREAEAARARAEYARGTAGAAGAGPGAVAGAQARSAVFNEMLRRANGDAEIAKKFMNAPEMKELREALYAENMAGASSGDSAQLRNLRLSVSTARQLAEAIGQGRDAERDAMIATEARREAAGSTFLTEQQLLPLITARVEAERQAELSRGLRDIGEEVQFTKLRTEAELRGGDAIERANVQIRLRQTFTERELAANGEIVQKYREQLGLVERLAAAERERSQARAYGSGVVAQQDLDKARADIENLRNKNLLTVDEARRASLQEEIRMLDTATDAYSGIRRAATRYYLDATNEALQYERIFSTGMSALEDQTRQFIQTGKFSFKDLFKTIITEFIIMEQRVLMSRLFQSLGMVGGGGAAGGVAAAGGLFGSLGSLGSLFGSIGGWFGGGVTQSAPTSLLPNLGSSLYSGGGGGVLGGIYAKGGAFDVMPFAAGGAVINRPTYFPMGGGRFGKAGEAGAEAIFPLEMTADGKMGVNARITGGGGGRSLVLNIDARGSQVGVERKIRAEIMRSLPMITNKALEESVAEANRGGTYARAMGRRSKD